MQDNSNNNLNDNPVGGMQNTIGGPDTSDEMTPVTPSMPEDSLSTEGSVPTPAMTDLTESVVTEAAPAETSTMTSQPEVTPVETATVTNQPEAAPMSSAPAPESQPSTDQFAAQAQPAASDEFVSTPSVDTSAASEQQPAGAPQKSNMKQIIMLVVIALVLVGLGAYYFFFMN